MSTGATRPPDGLAVDLDQLPRLGKEIADGAGDADKYARSVRDIENWAGGDPEQHAAYAA